jgi:hypothetical protein
MPEILGEIAILVWVVFVLCATAPQGGGRGGHRKAP